MHKITEESVRNFFERVTNEVDSGFRYTPPSHIKTGGLCMYVHGPRLPDIGLSPRSGKEMDAWYLDFTDAVPGCLVGKYLYEEAGIPLDIMFRYENTDASGISNALARRGLLEFEDHAVNILRWAQYYQDKGNTWHFSMREAMNPLINRGEPL